MCGVCVFKCVEDWSMHCVPIHAPHILLYAFASLVHTASCVFRPSNLMMQTKKFCRASLQRQQPWPRHQRHHQRQMSSRQTRREKEGLMMRTEKFCRASLQRQQPWPRYQRHHQRQMSSRQTRRQKESLSRRGSCCAPEVARTCTISYTYMYMYMYLHVTHNALRR